MHLHHYSVPVEGRPYARQCRDCGEPQVYNSNIGVGAKMTDVLVSKDDLRELIFSYRGQAAMPDPGTDALCDRLESLLD